MKTMKTKTTMLPVLCLLLWLGPGCSSPPPPPDLAPVVHYPAPPIVGAQIDRMGRAAVNTALVDPFDLLPGMTPDMVKDAYNAAADPAAWTSQFKDRIAANLAIFDGLGQAMCGGQLLAGKDARKGRYDALALLLADDQLYVDTGRSTCAQYLGVETGAMDCGGRTPSYSVVHVTYSALMTGKLTGLTDGLPTADDEGVPSADFPFLLAPNL